MLSAISEVALLRRLGIGQPANTGSNYSFGNRSAYWRIEAWRPTPLGHRTCFTSDPDEAGRAPAGRRGGVAAAPDRSAANDSACDIGIVRGARVSSFPHSIQRYNAIRSLAQYFLEGGVTCRSIERA